MDDPAEPAFVDGPAETSTDIVRTTIDHARKRLTLTVQSATWSRPSGTWPQ